MNSYYSPYHINPHQYQQQSRPVSRKVVSIPVQYVGPETKPAPTAALKPRETNRVASAVKIQKVFRGFLVRKSLRKIAEIKAEVDKVVRKIESGEIVKLIRRDQKERIRLNEALMSLLFKLDSVRGVDSGVRELRRSVIKRAIALQEKVDDIVANVNNAPSPVVGADDVSGPSVDEVMGVTVDSGNDQTLDGDDNAFGPVVDEAVDNVVASGCDQTLGVVDNLPGAVVKEVVDETVDYGHDRSFEAAEDVPGPVIDEVVDEDVKELGVVEEQKVDSHTAEINGEIDESEGEVDSELKNDEENYILKGSLDGLDEEYCCAMDIKDNCDDVKEDCCCDWIEEDMGTDLVEDGSEFVVADPLNTTECGEMNDGKEKNAEERDEGKPNKDMLQKMMEDNKKMMNLMKQLVEKNEKQAQMLNSLTHRIKQLENALLYDLLTRKEKTID